jgi:hypothetical protein
MCIHIYIYTLPEHFTRTTCVTFAAPGALAKPWCSRDQGETCWMMVCAQLMKAGQRNSDATTDCVPASVQQLRLHPSGLVTLRCA